MMIIYNELDINSNFFSNKCWDSLDEKIDVPLWSELNDEILFLNEEMNSLSEEINIEIQWLTLGK